MEISCYVSLYAQTSAPVSLIFIRIAAASGYCTDCVGGCLGDGRQTEFLGDAAAHDMMSLFGEFLCTAPGAGFPVRATFASIVALSPQAATRNTQVPLSPAKDAEHAEGKSRAGGWGGVGSVHGCSVSVRGAQWHNNHFPCCKYILDRDNSSGVQDGPPQ
jgi:hypothetical protein